MLNRFTPWYASAEDLTSDLKRYLEGRPILARPISTADRFWRWCRRNRTLASVGGMGLVLLLMLSIGGPFMAVKQADLADAAETETAKENTALAREKKAKENVQRTLGGYETTITQLVAMTKSEKLLQDPRFKPVLMKLLEHALAHFQRFIKEHKNDQSTKMRVRLTPKQRFEQPVPDPEKCPKSCPRSVEFIG